MEPDYIVIRDPDNEALNGKWYDRNDWPKNALSTEPLAGGAEYLYAPTPFIEVREDGAVAQVWMRSDESDG